MIPSILNSSNITVSPEPSIWKLVNKCERTNKRIEIIVQQISNKRRKSFGKGQRKKTSTRVFIISKTNTRSNVSCSFGQVCESKYLSTFTSEKLRRVKPERQWRAGTKQRIEHKKEKAQEKERWRNKDHFLLFIESSLNFGEIIRTVVDSKKLLRFKKIIFRWLIDKLIFKIFNVHNPIGSPN